MGMKRKIKKSAGYTSMPIEMAFEEFIAEKEAKNLSPATLHNYRQSFDFFYTFHGFTEEDTMDEITPQHFYKWINTLKLDGVKPTSINHYLRDCRCFFNWAMEPDREYINPPFRIIMVEGQEEQIKLFSDEELALLLEKPRRNDGFSTWRSWTIVNWVLATGNRAATICDVKIDDIDFNKKEIALGHTKNKKAQIIPLSSSLETVLKEYMRMWRKEVGEGAWLFPNVGEDKLTTNALRLAFGKYCKDRGCSHTNIHGLRHNFAKGWVKANGNMFVLQKILGHSTLDMTRRYVKMFADDIKEDFDKYNPLDNIKRNSRRTQNVKRS